MKTFSMIHFLGLASVILAGMPPLLAQTVWNPATQFSATANPNGVWSYGYEASPGGTFSLLTLSYVNKAADGLDVWFPPSGVTPTVWHNPTANPITSVTYPSIVVPTGALLMHPGSTGADAVIRFTAPSAGDYGIVGSFFGEDTTNPSTDVHILVNNSPVFDSVVTAYGSGPSFDVSVVTLAFGGNIDFIVGYGADLSNSADATGLTAQIFAIPEPTTYAALAGLAALGFVGWSRRFAGR
jgi:hypothetical protein